MKPVIGFANTVGDVILFYAVKYSVHAHQAHGTALAAYVGLGLASLIAWAWVFRAKPAKGGGTRPGGYPYGGGR